MNNNILIECSQENTNSQVFNNGDFNTRLTKPILINEGDSVQIAKTFIDNVSNTDSLVIIEEDIEIQIKNYLYVTNNGNAGIIYGSDIIKQDGEDYIYCNSTTLSDPQIAGCEVVNAIKFNAIYSRVSIRWGNAFQNFPLTYEDPYGNTHRFFVTISGKTTNDFYPSTFSHTVSNLVVLIKSGTLRADNSASAGALYTQFNIDVSSPAQYPITASSAPLHEISTPILRAKSFLLNKGNYTPNDFCDKINNNLGKNNVLDKFLNSNRTDALQSPYLDTMLNSTTATKISTTPCISIFSHPGDGINFRIRTLKGLNYAVGQVVNITITNPSAEFIADLTASGLTLAQITGNRTIYAFQPEYYGALGGSIFYNNPTVIPAGKAPLDTYIAQQTGGTYNLVSTVLDFDRTKFIRYDGETYISPAPGSSNFIGTNQIELAYSTDSNKFFWKYIHFPIYDANGNTIIQFIENNGAGTPTPPNSGKFIFNGKQGGIAFNSLEAFTLGNKNDPENSYDLWNGKLGFDVSKLCVDFGMRNTTVGAGTFQFPNFNLNNGAKWEDGISVSSARPTLDAMVVKSSYLNLQALNTIKSIEDLTTEIEADESRLQTILLNYGYYLIEVQAGFQNEIVGGESITQNISGIVNRYYSLGTYTSSEGSTFQYIHRGQPQYLQDIKIRILDNKKNLAVSIGSDNTIFIQVLRGQPSPAEIKQEIKNQKEVSKDELEQLNK